MSDASETAVVPMLPMGPPDADQTCQPLAGNESGYYIYVSKPQADQVPSSTLVPYEDRTYSESVASSGQSPVLDHMLDFAAPSAAVNLLDNPLPSSQPSASPEPVLTGLESPSYRAKVLGEQYSSNVFSSEFMDDEDDLFAVYRGYRDVPDMSAF
eukprot:TRINITY_DN853_c0_g4_i2.p1 TRINITY_DN853_c0_g4~~TRINITY_DN853_c0_g4_i2.p1  ORF type:complete len:155 (-),score=16.50 TRINITY_DN853_c0_g4_i2:244-708(-)